MIGRNVSSELYLGVEPSIPVSRVDSSKIYHRMEEQKLLASEQDNRKIAFQSVRN